MTRTAESMAALFEAAKHMTLEEFARLFDEGQDVDREEATP